MNRNTADRIIVTSNARMERVLDWYFDNFKWLDREKFLAPMESGVVELCEEQIEFTFESKGSWVEMAVYITVKPNLPAGCDVRLRPRHDGNQEPPYRPDGQSAGCGSGTAQCAPLDG